MLSSTRPQVRPACPMAQSRQHFTGLLSQMYLLSPAKWWTSADESYANAVWTHHKASWPKSRPWREARCFQCIGACRAYSTQAVPYQYEYNVSLLAEATQGDLCASVARVAGLHNKQDWTILKKHIFQQGAGNKNVHKKQTRPKNQAHFESGSDNTVMGRWLLNLWWFAQALPGVVHEAKQLQPSWYVLPCGYFALITLVSKLFFETPRWH